MKNRSLKFFAFIILFGASSCGAFRKKNKCVSCPTWDQVETGAEIDCGE